MDNILFWINNGLIFIFFAIIIHYILKSYIYSNLIEYLTMKIDNE